MLLFVVRGGEALLIHKKRGLGAGKINAPGGRIEPGEIARGGGDPRDARGGLRRRPRPRRRRGHLRFQFTDGYALARATFSPPTPARASRTRPTRPSRSGLRSTRIPFDAMWADDRLWIPLMLAGRPFRGRFVFDGERMLDHEMEEGEGIDL